MVTATIPPWLSTTVKKTPKRRTPTTLEFTKRRERWLAARNNVTMKGTRLAYNAGLQAWYVERLKKLVNVMADTTEREITALFEDTPAKVFFAEDADIASQARIVTNKLIAKFTALFNFKSKEYAEEMVRRSNKASASNVSNSLKKLSGGVTIKTSALDDDTKTILKASVSENIALIKSVGSDYLSKVQKTVMRSITTGKGLPDLLPALKKYKGISERHAKNVALDQTRKVYNNLNVERLKRAGVDEFEWIHSGGGQRPRKEHIAMSGKVYRFDNLPVIDARTGDRGVPGQAINCKCTLVPIIKFGEN